MNSTLGKIFQIYFEAYSDIPVLILNKEMEIIFCNKPFRKEFNLSKAPIGDPITNILKVNMDFEEPLDQDVQTGMLVDLIIAESAHSTTNKIIKGHAFFLENLYVIFFDIVERHDIHIVEKISRLNLEMTAFTRDVTKENQHLAEKSKIMEHESLADPLTGLWNRRYLSQMLTKLLIQAPRAEVPEQSDTGTTSSVDFGIIMYDIDNFKQINDRFGHDTGDIVLKTLSKTLLALIRQDDIATRFGGEEFLIIILDATEKKLLHVAEKLRKAFEELSFEGIEHPVTASFGATLRKRKDTQAALIKRADEALYYAKLSGKNRVTLWENMPSGNQQV